ncbi:MAG: hypothetical protein ACRDFS_04550 [Chloroflexota bacterium]
MALKPVFYRQSRTASSEQFQIMAGDERLGHLDLHYGQTDVYGTLVLDRELSEEDVMELRDAIDEDLVETADVTRQDFVLRVYEGKEIGLGIYSDDLIHEDIIAADGQEPTWE